jgi:hypothetical protein
MQSMGETDTDCGGPCGACPVEKQCIVNTDCQSEYCKVGVCKVPEQPLIAVPAPVVTAYGVLFDYILMAVLLAVIYLSLVLVGKCLCAKPSQMKTKIKNKLRFRRARKRR